VEPRATDLAQRVFDEEEAIVERVEPSASAGDENVAASLFATPMKDSNGETLGVVCAGSVREDAFGPDHRALFEVLAAYLGRQSEIDVLRQERARTKRMEQLGRLTSGVAHEVRNPINAILATAEALDLDIGEDPDHGESIRQIRLQVERVALLMRDLLDFGKPIPEANRTVCSLKDVCTESVELWRKTTALRHCGVEVVHEDTYHATAVVPVPEGLRRHWRVFAVRGKGRGRRHPVRRRAAGP